MKITINLKELEPVKRVSHYDHNVYQLKEKLRDADLILHEYRESSDTSFVSLCTEFNGKLRVLQTFVEVDFDFTSETLEIYL